MTELELRVAINRRLDDNPINERLQLQELPQITKNLDLLIEEATPGLSLLSGVWIQRQDDGIYEARITFTLYGGGESSAGGRNYRDRPFDERCQDNYFHGRANNVAQAIVVMIRELKLLAKGL